MYGLYLLAFLAGTLIGSFINSLIFRIANNLPLSGRSFCPKCKGTIAWYDLIPIISFLVLSGRCRLCKEKISPHYPIVEIVCGLLFVVVFSKVYQLYPQDEGFLIKLLFFWAFTALLFIIFIYDWKTLIIPDLVVGPLFFWALVYQILYSYNITETVLASLGVALFFLLLVIVTAGRGMGGGDVKLGLAQALICGWPTMLPALFLSFLTGAIVSVFLIIAGKKKIGQVIPFGPFLTSSTFIVMLYGEDILNWYLTGISKNNF